MVQQCGGLVEILVPGGCGGAVDDEVIDLFDIWRIKGYLDGSEEPDYPAAEAGHVYRVMQPGRIGGPDGALVDLDDVLVARVDGATAGDFDSTSGNWAIVPHKVVRTVGGQAHTVNGNLVTCYGDDEQTIADGGLSIEKVARNDGETFTGDVNVAGTQGYTSLQVGVLRAVWARFVASTDAPAFQFIKGRGTPAVPAVIAQNDELGAVFNFRGISNVSGADRIGAQIKPVCVDPTPSDTSMGGELQLLTTPIGSTTPALRATIMSTGIVRFEQPYRSKAYTVATLPAGTQGDRAHVTDATAPTFLGALTGGGAVVCPVFHNGAAWVAG